MRSSIIALAASATAIYAQQNCASSVAGTIVQPSGQPQVTACPNSLSLGETCGADEQCRNGAQCFGSNAGIIRACGNFNAACQRDEQCAYNTCNNGLCNGVLASSDYPTLTATSSSTASLIAAPTPSSFCPGIGNIGPGGAEACDISRTYPPGQRCEPINGCFFLVSVSSSGGTRTPSSSSPTTRSTRATSPTSTGTGPTTSSHNRSTTPVPSASSAPQSTTSSTTMDGAASWAGPLSGLGAFVAGVAAFVL